MKPTYEELEAKCQLQQNKLDAINKLMGVIESASDLAKDGIKKLEQQLAAVVAENAGLTKFIKDDCWIWDDKSEEYFDAGDCIPETPATDAYLTEVRAQGVDAAIERLIQKFEGTGHIGVPIMVLESFAAQLRQGGEHE